VRSVADRDYANKTELMQLFRGATVELDPDPAKLDEGARFPLRRPETLENPSTQPGLRDVRVAPIDIRTRPVDSDDYRRPFLGGQGRGTCLRDVAR
jgi:hypothetical protein